MTVEEKRYRIRVRGFDSYTYLARSASKARYAAYRAWMEAGYGRKYLGTISFIKFVREHIEVCHHLGRAQ